MTTECTASNLRAPLVSKALVLRSLPTVSDKVQATSSLVPRTVVRVLVVFSTPSPREPILWVRVRGSLLWSKIKQFVVLTFVVLFRI